MNYIFFVFFIVSSCAYGSFKQEDTCILGARIIENHFDGVTSSDDIIDFNRQDSSGNTPLHDAVIAQNFPLVQRLCMSGGNILAKNKKDESPLSLAFWAVQDNYSDTTKAIHRFLRDRI